jgi:RND superfamily putative drug exporter
VKTISALPGVEHVTSLVTSEANRTLASYQQMYAQSPLSPPFAELAHQLANGNLTKVTVELRPADHSDAAITLVNEVHALPAPGDLMPQVDGITPEQIDLMNSLASTLPLAILVIVVSIFVLLFLMTGSLIMPLKAIILNILSLSATFGGLVWIFQDGHLQSLLNFQSTGSIDATQPVLIFSIAFGLSMDYEVFLLSRIKERFNQTGNNSLSVSSGLQRTGGLITSEALLLAVVLGAFGMARIIFIQEIGIGLASAVIMDATLIRMLLVPATMRLLGNLNWWAPAPLRWLWQHIGLADTPVITREEIALEQTQPLREAMKQSA